MKNVKYDQQTDTFYVTMPISGPAMEDLMKGVVGIFKLIEYGDELGLVVTSLDGNVIPWPEESIKWR